MIRGKAISVYDPNNRPGGPHLIVTAKNANKVQFFDAATFAETGAIDMPGSTHELVLSLDGKKAFGTVYGGGRFGHTVNPDRRIAVIDLASRTLERTIDVGGNVAPHGIMLADSAVWATGELADCVVAIDPDTDRVERVAVGGPAHWLAVSHATDTVFAALKMDHYVVAIDARTRTAIDRIRIPHRVEGVAVSPDGETLFVCAHEMGEFHVIDVRTRALRRTVRIEGAEGPEAELRRVRVSPDGRYVVVSSNTHRHAAVFDADSLKQIGATPTGKSPMGFGFAADGRHAYLCCHDDAEVMVFDLATGRRTGGFRTDRGCEFVIAYS